VAKGTEVSKGSRDRQAVSTRLPVARVAVDISLAHLDRPFDYLVPASMDQAAVPGCRVRVRFAGQLVDGFLLERADTSEHPGRLARLERVISPEPVLTPEIFGLARAVAARYAGTLADVLRLAIPPRHAAAERDASQQGAASAAANGSGEALESATMPPQPDPGSAPRPDPGAPPRRPDPGSWARYTAGEAFLAALAEGRPVRAAWSALPGPEWPAEIAVAAATTAAAGRGVVIVVPDARDLARVGEALAIVPHVCLSADLGPAERYRRWLSALRGQVKVVAGTRAAMFAPVCNLGLVVLWDDGDDLHAEPRAPYPNAREVLALRAHRAGAAALIGGFARTAELTQLVEAGWARPLTGRQDTLRQDAPRVRAAPDEAELARDAAAMTARLPSLALRTARGALADGPVLVQVPRRGYLAAIACGRCRAQARCAVCAGPLQIGGSGEVPGCRWCGALAADWTCKRCGSDRLRALVTGAARTAEELGRAFPGVPVRASGGQHVLATVPDSPALVIATPGAEPVAAGGYAGALLLDGWALLGRPSLRAAEEAVRRWLNAAALVRPGGQVVVLAEAALPAVQALIRWDPVHFAERELAERAELGFPPAVRMAAVSGTSAAVAELLSAASLPAGAEVLGPVPVEFAAASGDVDQQERALIRVPRPAGADLAQALHAAQAVRSARKDGGGVRVQLDPAEVA
jgi:primosomal protein N' (replication factor Y) (superfamily II helicase)